MVYSVLYYIYDTSALNTDPTERASKHPGMLQSNTTLFYPLKLAKAASELNVSSDMLRSYRHRHHHHQHHHLAGDAVGGSAPLAGPPAARLLRFPGFPALLAHQHAIRVCVVAHAGRVGASAERAAEGVLGESDGTSPVGDDDGM